MMIIHLLTFNLALPCDLEFQEGRRPIDLRIVGMAEACLADVLLKIDGDRVKPTYPLPRDEAKKTIVVPMKCRSVSGLQTKDTVVGSRRKTLREDLKTVSEATLPDDLVRQLALATSAIPRLRWVLPLRAQQRVAG